MKKCWKCQSTKSLEDFSKNKTKKDGLMDECKSCRKEQDRLLRQRKKEKNILDQPEARGVQKCSRCQEEKSLTEFTRDNSRASGFQHRCKPCQKEYHAEWRARSEKYQQYQENYYQENREYINERNRAYYYRNKEWLLPLMNQRRFEKKYNITKEEALNILAEQDGCAICHTDDPGRNGWCVDHNHDTGEVRGILCGKCNTGIAFLGDNVEGVSRAISYLS